MAGIRLIAGLGNPGRRFEGTPHNVGAAWVAGLAARFSVTLAGHARFKGRLGHGAVLGHDVWFLIPSTFMNLSGESVGALARYYKIEPGEILIAHDEVDFPSGITKLKTGGRHHTHNGIASIVAGLGNRSDFARLRIGIGHPGKQRMIGFLTGSKLRKADRLRIEASTEMDDELIEIIVTGDMQKAMNRLHAPKTGEA